MKGNPARHLFRSALLVAIALGTVPARAQTPPAAPTTTAEKPKDAAGWVALPPDALRARAEARDVAAMEELGRRLMAGADIERDTKAGADWYRKAAEAGSPTACFTLGVLYERGFAVERDSLKAIDWYRKAAAGKVAAAQHNLALMLRDGRGTRQDVPRAIELLQSAARQGMTASMFMLGDVYERGGPTPKDPSEALAWFTLANAVELRTNDNRDTPLARTARARIEALNRTIGDADRERAQAAAQEEFQQIVAALKPPPEKPAAPSPDTAAPAAPAPGWPPISRLDQVKVIQKALIDLNRWNGKIDGDAGPATRTAIRDFEKSAGLAETGLPSREVYVALVAALANRETAKPAEAPTTPTPSDAWPDKSIDQVRVIQQLLVELKYLSAEPDGTAGPVTKRAIRDYQRKAGLKETGEPSQGLFDALKATRAKGSE